MSGMTITLQNRLSPQDVDVLTEALTYWASATSCSASAAQRRDKIATIMSKLLLIKLAFVPHLSDPDTSDLAANEFRPMVDQYIELSRETGNG